jgi:hypothetical protein
LENAILKMLEVQGNAQQTIAALQQNLIAVQQTQSNFLAHMAEIKA